VKSAYQSGTLIEKERIRRQINVQVEEYLRRGGEIHVLNTLGESSKGIGRGAWNDQEELASHLE
jgi:hypothetical protein